MSKKEKVNKMPLGSKMIMKYAKPIAIKNIVIAYSVYVSSCRDNNIGYVTPGDFLKSYESCSLMYDSGEFNDDIVIRRMIELLNV